MNPILLKTLLISTFMVAYLFAFAQQKQTKYSYLPYVNSIEIYNDTSILIATNKGVYTNSGDTITPIFDTAIINKSKPNLIVKQGKNIWIGTYNSSIIRIHNNSISEFSFRHLFGLSPQIVTSIFCKDNNVWIGTSEGDVIRYNYRTKSFSKYKKHGNSTIYDIYYNDYLWIATYNGMFYYHRNKWKRKKNLSIGYAVFQDDYNTIWSVGKNAQNMFEVEFLNFRKWELLNCTCFSYDLEFRDYTIDKYNNLWFTSNHGLIKFNMEEETCKTVYHDKSLEKLCLQSDTIVWVTNRDNDLIKLTTENKISNPNKTLENTYFCDDIVKSGGSGKTELYVDLGQNNGQFKLWYDMKGVPDKMTIYCDNQIIFETKNALGVPDYVRGTETAKVKFTNRIIKIIVEGNIKSTVWYCKIHCPD